MNTEVMDLAVNRGLMIGIGPFVAGLVVVAVLIGALFMGRRIWRRELPRPRPDEQPRVPDGGPVYEETMCREPDEMPQSDTRTLPHELHGYGNASSRPSPGKPRNRWSNGGSGSFGSGGLGAH